MLRIVVLTEHALQFNHFTPMIMLFNLPPVAIQVFLQISHDNLIIDQDNKIYLIILSILMTCYVDNVRIFLGEVAC